MCSFENRNPSNGRVAVLSVPEINATCDFSHGNREINKQMASAVSDDSDIAPSDFPLSSSEDDLLDKNEIADKCPLCRSTKKYFFCADCIRNGDFYASHCVQRESSQRYVKIVSSATGSPTGKANLPVMAGSSKRKWHCLKSRGKSKSF